jgi:TPR repeat protein
MGVGKVADPRETLADRLTAWAFTFGAAHLLDQAAQAASARHGTESLTVSLLRKAAPHILGEIHQAFGGASAAPPHQAEYYASPQRQIEGRAPAGDQQAEAYYQAALALIEQKNFDAALQSLTAAGERNHPEAQYVLGALYAGVEDYAAAELWLSRAAGNGHVEAGKELAKVMAAKAAAQAGERKLLEEQRRKESVEECIARGRAARAGGNHGEAVQYFRAAAEAGHAEAMTEFGLCYYKGEGIAQDYGEAIDWFMKAATAGDGAAMNYVGTCHAFGRGLTKDYGEAVDWWRMAAERGVDGAQYNLGVAYLRGHGVTADSAEALRWFQLAAAQGHTTARQKAAELGGEEEPRARGGRQREQRQESTDRSGGMTRAAALEILDLKEGATPQEIRAAYNRLMQHVHPDVGGSNFFAKQLNAAREALLS